MIEIIATNANEAKMIETAKADRVELVTAFSEGGLTPSIGIIESTIKAVTIPVNVMIRPHPMSFIYSNDEIKVMKKDIAVVKRLGANGVVLGVLDSNRKINEQFLKELLKACQGLEVTFHKAFDHVPDLVNGITTLTKYKEITNILTAGGTGNITGNIQTIKEIINNKNHLKIMIGGGLNFDNIKGIIKKTNADAYHFGTAIRYNNSHFETINRDKLISLIKLIKNTENDLYKSNYLNKR